MFLRERLDREVQFRSRSIGDVNASFARIKYICTPLEARRDPDEWENSYVDARAGWLDRRFWQRQPRGRVTLCNFALGDNCGNVDKMWEGGRRLLHPARAVSVFDEVEVLEVAPHAVLERGRDRHRGRVAVAHEPLSRVPLEVAEPVPQLRLERLDAWQPHRIERAGEG